MFNDEGKPELVIASELNRRQILAENGSCWSRAKVHQILTSEKYIGNSVYNKTSFKLKQQYVTNPEEDWIRYDGAYTPIVSVEKFNRANEIIRARAARLSEDELLEKLRVLLRKKEDYQALSLMKKNFFHPAVFIALVLGVSYVYTN